MKTGYKRFMSMTLMMAMLIVTIAGGMATQTFAQGANNMKKAVLLVSFGTTHADTRARTIDAIEDRLEKEFSKEGYEVRTAFTSRIIMRILKNRDGIIMDNPQEALTKLKNEGYTDIIVQPTHIINGEEAEYLEDEVSVFEDDFNSIKLGKSLLTSPQDYKNVVKALIKQMPYTTQDEAVLFMGHGTHHPGNSAYGMMNYVIKDMGLDNVYLGTVEGYPMLDDVVVKLKEKGYKKVILMPFMFVAGDHAKNDMAGDEEDSWKTILTKEGFEVETKLIGLGENYYIQNIFVQHAKDAMADQEEDVATKKANYSKGIEN